MEPYINEGEWNAAKGETRNGIFAGILRKYPPPDSGSQFLPRRIRATGKNKTIYLRNG